jgi:predicted bacteriocin transport accessory protein
MKKILTGIAVFTLVLLTGCSEQVEPMDNYGYDKLPEQHVVMDVEFSEIQSSIAAGDSVILYIGRNTCPHCYDYLPLLNEAVNESEMTVTYLNYERYKDGNGNLPTEMVDFFQKIEVVGVPLVLLYKDGNVVDRFSTDVASKAKIKQRLDAIK